MAQPKVLYYQNSPQRSLKGVHVMLGSSKSEYSYSGSYRCQVTTWTNTCGEALGSLAPFGQSSRATDAGNHTLSK